VKASIVAALFVSRKGPYCGRPDIDAWDEERDARKYAGPCPVVAHPPCQLWTNFTGVNYMRYGGAHNRPANDGGCFAHALRCVGNYGGVLEHPAGSYAWETFALARPHRDGWMRVHQWPLSYWTCEVNQAVYGHRARKRTWLLYVGDQPPFDFDWSDSAGTHQCGWFDRSKPTLSKNESSATPPEFAELLIAMARNARKAAT